MLVEFLFVQLVKSISKIIAKLVPCIDVIPYQLHYEETSDMFISYLFTLFIIIVEGSVNTTIRTFKLSRMSFPLHVFLHVKYND